jgi:hypothetical protein
MRLLLIFQAAQALQRLHHTPVKDGAEIAQWPTAAITAVAGLIGVAVGVFLSGWLAARRDRSQRRLAFVEQQVSEFYSPMMGLRAEIQKRWAVCPIASRCANRR